MTPAKVSKGNRHRRKNFNIQTDYIKLRPYQEPFYQPFEKNIKDHKLTVFKTQNGWGKTTFISKYLDEHSKTIVVSRRKEHLKDEIYRRLKDHKEVFEKILFLDAALSDKYHPELNSKRGEADHRLISYVERATSCNVSTVIIHKTIHKMGASECSYEEDMQRFEEKDEGGQFVYNRFIMSYKMFSNMRQNRMLRTRYNGLIIDESDAIFDAEEFDYNTCKELIKEFKVKKVKPSHDKGAGMEYAPTYYDFSNSDQLKEKREEVDSEIKDLEDKAKKLVEDSKDIPEEIVERLGELYPLSKILNSEMVIYGIKKVHKNKDKDTAETSEKGYFDIPEIAKDLEYIITKRTETEDITDKEGKKVQEKYTGRVGIAILSTRMNDPLLKLKLDWILENLLEKHPVEAIDYDMVSFTPIEDLNHTTRRSELFAYEYAYQYRSLPVHRLPGASLSNHKSIKDPDEFIKFGFGILGKVFQNFEKNRNYRNNNGTFIITHKQIKDISNYSQSEDPSTLTEKQQNKVKEMKNLRTTYYDIIARVFGNGKPTIENFDNVAGKNLDKKVRRLVVIGDRFQKSKIIDFCNTYFNGIRLIDFTGTDKFGFTIVPSITIRNPDHKKQTIETPKEVKDFIWESILREYFEYPNRSRNNTKKNTKEHIPVYAITNLIWKAEQQMSPKKFRKLIDWYGFDIKRSGTISSH